MVVANVYRFTTSSVVTVISQNPIKTVLWSIFPIALSLNCLEVRLLPSNIVPLSPCNLALTMEWSVRHRLNYLNPLDEKFSEIDWLQINELFWQFCLNGSMSIINTMWSKYWFPIIYLIGKIWTFLVPSYT